MLAFTIVIDLNKPKNHCSCLLNCCEIMLVHELDLERVKEALAHCVMASPKLRFHNNFLCRSCLLGVGTTESISDKPLSNTGFHGRYEQ